MMRLVVLLCCGLMVGAARRFAVEVASEVDFSRSVGSTQTAATQIRSPLQSVSFEQPEPYGDSGGQSGPAGGGTQEAFSARQSASLPPRHRAFKSFTCSHLDALSNPEWAAAAYVIASAAETMLPPIFAGFSTQSLLKPVHSRRASRAMALATK